MIDKKLEQLKMLKSISLTEKERSVLRASVARGIQTLESKPRVSIFYTGLQHGLRIGLSTFIFIIFVGGSVSVVADNSLPGDALYSFKINVNEEVKGAFIKNPSDKISWQKSRIDNRLGEIKTLAATKTLTKAKQETAQRALNTHIESLSEELSKTDTTEALQITADLEESLKNQKEELKKYAVEGDEKNEDAFKAVDETLAKVSSQENKIVSKELEKISKELEEVTNIVNEDLENTTPPSPEQPSSPEQ
jgi:hypothetical protein